MSCRIVSCNIIKILTLLMNYNGSLKESINGSLMVYKLYYHNVVCDLLLKRVLKDIYDFSFAFLGKTSSVEGVGSKGETWCRALSAS